MRSRARLASTLEEALDSLFFCGGSGGEESENELNFDEFEDDQLCVMSEAKEKRAKHQRQIQHREGREQSLVMQR